MGDEEQATLDGQFYEYAKLLDNKRDGTTITLYRSDFWMRQAKILDDRKLTMTDTGIVFNKFSKTELNFDEWMEFLGDLCDYKSFDREKIEETLTNCGLPGQTPVVVPQYHTLYCPPVFDTYLCWPPTPAGEKIFQNCPAAHRSDTTRSAYRRCGYDGLWFNRPQKETSAVGWTNYTPCFPSEVQNLFIMAYNDENDGQQKMAIAQHTRYLEIVGLSISLVALITSLLIYWHYRCLRNNRTRIHQCLFSAMVGQVIIRLILYIDQEIVRQKLVDHSKYVNDTTVGIENTPYVCESAYILLEYGVTSMFMWMFIEGLYLHSVVSTNPLRNNVSHRMHMLLGWGFSAILTSVWAAVNAINYKNETVKRCWYGYNFEPVYWIVQGPRLGVILVNMLFLLKIMRVLIIALRQNENSELKMIRQAVLAALILLPLLGITSVLNMTEAPLEGGVVVFALWSYITHFLRSFQGFFIALIYCFLNAEVIYVLRKLCEDYKASRSPAIRRRPATRRRRAPRKSRDNVVQDDESSNGKEKQWIPFQKMTVTTPATQVEVTAIPHPQAETCCHYRYEIEPTVEQLQNVDDYEIETPADHLDNMTEMFSMDM